MHRAVAAAVLVLLLEPADLWEWSQSMPRQSTAQGDVVVLNDADAHVPAQTRELACKRMSRGNPEVQQACQSIAIPESDDEMSWSHTKQCPTIELPGVGRVHVSEEALNVDKMSPYFLFKQNSGYYQLERSLLGPAAYTVEPGPIGCGVFTSHHGERGERIGLAAVVTDVMNEGFLVRLQMSPWFGANINHCDHPNLVLEEDDSSSPLTLWGVLMHNVAPHTELLADYNMLHARFPTLIAGAPRDWACPRT